MYLRDFLALKPFHDYSLCSVCILPQPAFYSQSAVCILHAVCILPLIRNLHSAVRSLLVKKFYLFTVHFSTAPLRNFDKGQAVLDTVHVTNFVQSHHCRWRTDSFTFVRVVSSIFFDFRRLSSDLR